MQIKYRKTKGGNEPDFERAGSSGITIYCPQPIKIPPWQTAIISTGISFPEGLPEGIEIQVRNIKENILLKRLVFQDTGDMDFKDEYGIVMVNFSQELIELKRNDKLCQMVFASIVKPELQKVL